MPDALNSGSSALLAFQRAIATTSHNIANSATEGYTRQRVSMEANSAIRHSFGHVGQGVGIGDIQRVEDVYAERQIIHTGSELAKLNTLNLYSSQIDTLFADTGLNLSPALTDFFGALDDASNNPTDNATRAAVIANAETLTGRFNSMHRNLDLVQRQMANDVGSSIDAVNDLTTDIAALNLEIMTASKDNHGRAPNDLIDRRNLLLQDLSEYVDIHTIDTRDHAMDVYIANGQPLLTGQFSRELNLTFDAEFGTKLSVALDTGPSQILIGDLISGGKLGGIIDFNRNVLTPARNELGRMAVALAGQINEQHRKGIDGKGDPGGDLFKLPEVAVIDEGDATGSAVITATFTDTAAITASDYELEFDGVNYSLTRLSDNVSVSGASPIAMDGFELAIGAGMAAGDRYTIAPTRFAARELGVLLRSPSELALASPLRTNTALANAGTGEISVPLTSDPADSGFTTAINIVFNDPPATFNLVEVGSGTVVGSNIAYTPNGSIALNGWSTSITGTPMAGDLFTVEPNVDGIGSNHNGLIMAEFEHQPLIEGDTTLTESYGAMLANIGSRTRQSELNSATMQSLHNSALERRENASGVNLDEEAIALTRYQQAYQAAAQIINTADTMFQTLIGAIR